MAEGLLALKLAGDRVASLAALPETLRGFLLFSRLELDDIFFVLIATAYFLGLAVYQLRVDDAGNFFQRSNTVQHQLKTVVGQCRDLVVSQIIV